MNLGNQVYLAAEDSLGLAFGRRLIKEHSTLQIWREFDGGGYGRLKNNASKFNNMAQNGLPVLLLTDLDIHPCCPALMSEWLGKGRVQHSDFLIRICVHEAESWLLAHPDPLAKLFKLPISRFPLHPDSLIDPKANLLKLALKAPSRISKALLPNDGSTAKVGIEYNDILCPLVASQWDIDEASRRSPSLQKARIRIHTLALKYRLT